VSSWVDIEHGPWPLSQRSLPQRAWVGANPHTGPPSDGKEVEAEEVRDGEVDDVVVEEGAQATMRARVFKLGGAWRRLSERQRGWEMRQRG
jgi:hypothetical protein